MTKRVENPTWQGDRFPRLPFTVRLLSAAGCRMGRQLSAVSAVSAVNLLVHVVADQLEEMGMPTCEASYADERAVVKLDFGNFCEHRV